MAKMIIVEASKCLGCRSCQLACAVAHAEIPDLLAALAEGVRPRVAVVGVEGQWAVPLQCRQCETAPCVAICPTGALTKPAPDSPVLTNDKLCIGCKSCVLVCPFGVINIGGQGQAIIKCDLCLARTAAGAEPACVEACPTGALKYEELQAVIAAARQRAAQEVSRAETSRLQLLSEKK